MHSCKPQLAQSILTDQGMSDALEGKLLISILAGMTISQLKAWVPASTRVVRAMPNTPCKVRRADLRSSGALSTTRRSARA
jgi:pyrroline-5-carboxylate reductase